MANKNDTGMSPIAAGMVGAVVGAAVGATAVVLSEEKNRKAIGKKFNEVKEKVQDAASNMVSGVSDKAEEVVSQGKAKVEEAKKSLKSKL